MHSKTVTGTTNHPKKVQKKTLEGYPKKQLHTVCSSGPQDNKIQLSCWRERDSDKANGTPKVSKKSFSVEAFWCQTCFPCALKLSTSFFEVPVTSSPKSSDRFLSKMCSRPCAMCSRPCTMCSRPCLQIQAKCLSGCKTCAHAA